MIARNPVLGGGGIHHVSIHVPDLEAARRFYLALGCVEKLAWGHDDTRAVLLDTGDGSCVELLAGAAAGSAPHLALRTACCDAALAAARAAGAPVTMEPADVDIPTTPMVTSVRIARCRGPGGEEIEFVEFRGLLMFGEGI